MNHSDQYFKKYLKYKEKYRLSLKHHKPCKNSFTKPSSTIATS